MIRTPEELREYAERLARCDYGDVSILAKAYIELLEKQDALESNAAMLALK